MNSLGRPKEAEALGREVLDAKLKMYGGLDHNSAIATALSYSQTLEDLDRFDEAIDLLRRTADASARTLGSEHSTTLTALANLARSLHLKGNLDEAEALFRRVLDVRLRMSGESATSTLAVMN